MGLFDIFNKKKEEPVIKPEEKEVEAIGWQAIEQEFLRVYPGQDNPKHYGTLIKWVLGGKDPLDGISIYDGGSYWHFVATGTSSHSGRQKYTRRKRIHLISAATDMSSHSNSKRMNMKMKKPRSGIFAVSCR